MPELVYNPLEDNDITLPLYKKDGKPLILPAFICGVKTIDITSRNDEDLLLAELEFEIHESAEKVEVQTFHENEDNVYDYRRPKDVVRGDVFVGTRIKSGDTAKIWMNKSKPSGKMNRIYLQELKAIGVEIKTKKIEHEGKKIDAPIIPELSDDLLLGLPVFIYLGETSFKAKDGRQVTYPAVQKYIAIAGMPRVDVLQNSFDEAKRSPRSKEADPFGDMDDDLPF